ncbi:MAG: glycosyltransferase [Oscillospiraceae bacterium]|nr:glycosyltransferase [Oscillospiraceae bacterium]
MSLLTVIIPSYNEEDMISITSDRISSLLREAQIQYELLFVDDGSKDNTWKLISELSVADPSIRGAHFSRNFGKEAAILAGLTESHGDCCVVIDCDLQHPPEKIIEMYHLWEQGYEIVEGQKSSRGKESGSYSFASKTFYAIISKASGIDMANASDFKLLDRRAVDVLVNMREQGAFFRALSSWIGFKTTSVSYDVQERMAGESKWSTSGLIKYAVNNITSFSTAPMQFITLLGGVTFVVALVFAVIALIQKITGVAYPGFTTVILIIAFIGSMIMISLGIIGYYIARIFEEVKGRPRYIISSTCGVSTRQGNDQKTI